MGSGVVIAAAAARRKRLEGVLDRFRVAGATAPDRARSLADMGIAADGEVTTLMRDGVIRAGTERSTWYLNEGAYIAFRDSRDSRPLRIVLAIVVAVLAIVVAAVLVYRSNR